MMKRHIAAFLSAIVIYWVLRFLVLGADELEESSYWFGLAYGIIGFSVFRAILDFKK